MDLDLGEEDMPVTGFAVASNKRNADFHELFPSVPEGDYLIEGEHVFAVQPGLLTLSVHRLRLCATTRNSDTRQNIHI